MGSDDDKGRELGREDEADALALANTAHPGAAHPLALGSTLSETELANTAAPAELARTQATGGGQIRRKRGHGVAQALGYGRRHQSRTQRASVNLAPHKLRRKEPHHH
ncbi:MAG: hypothetical protein GY811_08015 [Myxococcales bacterium]|nr:hypothetical protein [Myxococcales bacterium]